ncbi:hypothetical protein IWW36_001282 [Coemansia brasiliensis]|uniref:NTF2 domain-containing protein n=1 Tax=Coemansia brasiliensis TaxID=2650707 RepID=A0A9W8IBY1_9FUNG|nr:hypothetical protein IWW36_001282 [Coemansia brasiliensis]
MSSTQQNIVNGTTAPAANEAQKISAQEIGWLFAHDYYSYMNSEPKKLQYLYGKKSTCVHGTEGKIVTQANGQQIYATIAAEEFQGSQIVVTTVDILPSINGSIIVQVLGKIAKDTQPFQRFAQTFLLAEQPSGYYLHNDILRYLEDDIEENEPVAAIATATSEAAAAPTTEAPKEKAPVAELPTAPKKDEKVDPDEAAKPVASEPAKPAAEKKPEPAAKPAPAAESKPKQPKEKPAVPAEQPAKTEQPAAAVAPEPAKPTSWANLAADRSGRWGNTIAKVEGTVAPAATTSSGAASAPSRASTPASNARDSRRKMEMPSVFLKNIPLGSTIGQVKSAMKKFGGSVYVDCSPSRTTGVAEYATEEEKKAALDAGEVMIGDARVVIEERRQRQGNGRRDGGAGGKQSHSSRSASGEFERVGSGRGSRSRTATNSAGGNRPRGGKQ